MGKTGAYSLVAKLAALAALERNAGNLYRTAKELGIPKQTLSGWVRQQRAGKLVPPATPERADEAALDEQLERLARQMVAAMPDKVDEASLQDLARALTIVLDSLNHARADKEKVSHAREKLAEILERYAAAGGAAGTAEPADGA